MCDDALHVAEMKKDKDKIILSWSWIIPVYISWIIPVLFVDYTFCPWFVH